MALVLATRAGAFWMREVHDFTFFTSFISGFFGGMFSGIAGIDRVASGAEPFKGVSTFLVGTGTAIIVGYTWPVLAPLAAVGSGIKHIWNNK